MRGRYEITEAESSVRTASRFSNGWKKIGIKLNHQLM
jgi:hypothetical protein